MTFAFFVIERIRTGMNKEKKTTNCFFLLLLPSSLMRLAVNDYSFSHTRTCAVVWKRVIGTDVNPAWRRLITAEVRAHRSINQFDRSSREILKEPPKLGMNRVCVCVCIMYDDDGPHQFWSEMRFKKRRRCIKDSQLVRGQMKVTVLYIFSC